MWNDIGIEMPRLKKPTSVIYCYEVAVVKPSARLSVG